MIKPFHLLIHLFLFSVSINSYAGNDENFSFFTGGMMVHTGYLKNNRQSDNINGLTSGLGGQLLFHLGPHFRLGSEGYVSTYNYPDEGFYRIGWGGIIAGYSLNKQHKTSFFPSLTLARGKVHDLFMVSGDVNDNLPDEITYRIYSDFFLIPAISLHYALKTKITLTFKVDYMIPFSDSHRSNFAWGPRFYMGVLFVK